MAHPVLGSPGAPYPLHPRAADEAFDRDGAVRPHYAGVLDALAGAGVAEAAARVAAGVAAANLTHGAGERLHRFVVDPVPRVFPATEWAGLEAGLAQRVRALDRFVADVYGPQETLREGSCRGRW
jgi:uncharacterized circularly permuted ATP-grasp superfamily protein